ncbi:MAG: hypothetical protein ACLQOO_04485 [Terriglobia bacterium]
MKTLNLAASLLALVLFAAWTLPAQQIALETDSTADGSVPTVRNAPRLLKFSGVLTDDAGKPLKGPVQLTFLLYQDQEGGLPLWQEVQTVRLDSLGRYSVLLGATESAGLPLEPFAFGEAHWLGVQVQAQPERPRTLLVSVPYAMRAEEAETLGGRSATDFVLLSDLADQVRQLMESGAVAAATAASSSGASGASVPSSPLGPSGPPGPSALTNAPAPQSGAPENLKVASGNQAGVPNGVEKAGDWREDFGSAQLHNGVAEVGLLPSFLDTVDIQSGYHVFLTPSGDSRGLYVAQKTADGFEVREHGGGKSNISFDYRLVARARTPPTAAAAAARTPQTEH